MFCQGYSKVECAQPKYQRRISVDLVNKYMLSRPSLNILVSHVLMSWF